MDSNKVSHVWLNSHNNISAFSIVIKYRSGWNIFAIDIN
jgi:hypothetical protein